MYNRNLFNFLYLMNNLLFITFYEMCYLLFIRYRFFLYQSYLLFNANLFYYLLYGFLHNYFLYCLNTVYRFLSSMLNYTRYLFYYLSNFRFRNKIIFNILNFYISNDLNWIRNINFNLFNIGYFMNNLN